jgi:phage N-6-adenine-methyltransferase
MGRKRKFPTNADRQRAYRRRKRVPVYLRHRSTEWETPSHLFETLNREFGFTVDVCATPENAKCQTFFTKEQNGLAQEWTGVVWCNPPYGLQLREWSRKAYESSQRGATVVCLLPNRTDTRWWHEWILPYAEIRFIRGRLKFNGVRNSAPFPSVIAVFRSRISITAGVDS